MKKIIFFILGLCITSNVFGVGTSEDIIVGTNSRNILSYAPDNLKKDRPLLISLHGMNQDPAYQQSMAHWEDVADTARFVVVYPYGIDKSWDISGTRDIDFILAIIDIMHQRYEIDKNRVYLSGFSMGGMMTYHAMENIADKIAAFAPVSGYPMQGSSFTSSRPIPIIHIHGTADDVVPYSGVSSIIEGWRTRNNCPSNAITTSPYPASKPNSKSKLEYWGTCDENTDIALITLDGKGHWHSNDDAGVNTSNEIWNFVKNYSLTGSTIVVVPAPRDSIYNGKFDQGKTAWTLNVWDGEANGIIENEEYKIEINSIGSENHQIQLIQSGLILENEQSYKVTFDAYSTANRTLELNVEQHESPWTSYLNSQKNFDLTKSKKTYSFIFTMTQATDLNGRLSFNVGASTEPIYLDNISIAKCETPIIVNTIVPFSQMKAAYLEKKLYVNFENSKNENIQFIIYNLQGLEVLSKTFSNKDESEHQIDFSPLPSGCYLVKIISGSSLQRTINILHF